MQFPLHGSLGKAKEITPNLANELNPVVEEVAVLHLLQQSFYEFIFQKRLSINDQERFYLYTVQFFFVLLLAEV